MPNPEEYRGKAALVTGGSRGIGRAIALALAARGTDVAICGRTEESLEATRRDIKALGVNAWAIKADVSRLEDIEAMIDTVRAGAGRIDVLVNNAGITRDQLLLRMSEEDFDRVVSVNLKGTWNFVKAAARPLMKVGGRIVNISSVVGVTGNAGQANYAASKAGVIGLTRSVAKELSGRGVTVNAIAPGYIATDMTAAIDDNAAAELKRAIPLARIGESEDIARAVEYLVVPGGSYITGQTLIVDGGLSL
jgi:3-oxoacyl-[acyl-carrier protein] reductase